MSRIGYNQLTAAEKKLYDIFESAFATYSPAVNYNGIGRNVDIMKVLGVALADNPRVVYFNKSQIRFSRSAFGTNQIHFSRAISPLQAKSMQTRLDEALNNAVEKIELMNPLSNYDKLICIYEYLQDNVSYDSKELDVCKVLRRDVNPLSHNAYGALVNHTGVCDGIASAFSLIAQNMGFDCTSINGKAAFRESGFTEHAWNIIKVSDNFYHVDATWDINHKEQSGDYSYEYLCISDDSASRDHEWDVTAVPLCPREDISFYSHNRCIANSLSQIDEIFRRYSKSNQKIVRLKIADGIAIPAPEDKYLGQKLVDVAASVGRYSSVTYIWNKNSRCFYAKFTS